MKNTMSNSVSFHRRSIAEVNDYLASIPKKAKALPTCVRHYGPYKRGIEIARKNGHSNETIANLLWEVCKVGPRTPRTGNFSPKTAKTMIATFINNY